MRYQQLLIVLLFLFLQSIVLQSCSSTIEPEEKKPVTDTLHAPTLLSPAHDTAGVIDPPLLQWNVVQGATHYHVQISTHSDFTRLKDSITLAGTSHLPRNLDIPTSYFWRVRARKGDELSPWSEGRRFSMLPVIHPVGPGTTLKYHVQDQLTATADTMTMLIMEEGIVYEGATGVTRIMTTYKGSTENKYLKYEANGNISFYEDDKWTEIPFGTRETYEIGPDTTGHTAQHTIVSQGSVQFSGLTNFILAEVTYVVENVTTVRNTLHYNISTGFLDSYESRTFFYGYSPELRFLITFQNYFSTSSTTHLALDARLIKIEQ